MIQFNYKKTTREGIMKTSKKENTTTLETLIKEFPDEIEFYFTSNTKRSNVIHSIGSLSAVKPTPSAMQPSTKTQSNATANER